MVVSGEAQSAAAWEGVTVRAVLHSGSGEEPLELAQVTSESTLLVSARECQCYLQNQPMAAPCDAGGIQARSVDRL